MKRNRRSVAPNIRQPFGIRLLAGVLLATGLVVLTISIAGDFWDGEQALSPFVWRDVAVIHLLCAIPLAGVLAGCIARICSSVAWPVIATASWFVSLVLSTDGVASVSDPLAGFLLRPAIALGFALSIALAFMALQGARRAYYDQPGWRMTAILAALALLAALLPPATYVAARCRHDRDRLGEFLGQSRFGEARVLVHRLLVLDPNGQLNSRPLPQLAADVDQTVRSLKSSVAVPLPPQATDDLRLVLARELAMLGETEAAMRTLQSLREPAAVAEALNLVGTICENQDDWQAGLEAYSNSKAAWQPLPNSAAHAAGRLKATTGIAYCQRKLGQYAAAEQSYRQVLALSPTADSHFLLAQFYEDSQQSGAARIHARRAMAMAPNEYRQKGEKLLDKMAVYHFGCLETQRQ